MTERDYVLACRDWLRSHDITAVDEVPCAGRSIDLVFILGDNIHSCEFKLRHCRKAFVQARDHSMGADFSWVVLAREPRVIPDYHPTYRHIGVMHVIESGELEVLKEAHAPNRGYKPFRERIAEWVLNVI